MKHVFILLSMILMFNACGYKPSVQYTKQILHKNIYAHVKIDLRDPENAVFVKDALNQAVLERFGATLTSKEKADTQLNIVLRRVSFSPAQYDAKGFVIAYNNTVSLAITRTNKQGDSKSYNVQGHHDFPIEANSVISEKSRYDAIKSASNKALNHFIARLSYEGYKHEHQ